MRLRLSKIGFQPQRSSRFHRYQTSASLNVTKAVTLQGTLVNPNILETETSSKTRRHNTQALSLQMLGWLFGYNVTPLWERPIVRGLELTDWLDFSEKYSRCTSVESRIRPTYINQDREARKECVFP